MKYENVRHNTARNPAIDLLTLEKLAMDPEAYVRYGAAANSSAANHTLTTLAKDKKIFVKNEVARNPSTPAEVLEKLSKTSKGRSISRIFGEEIAVHIRASVAQNNNTPKHLLVHLAEDMDVDVRSAVAKNFNTPIEIIRNLADDKEWSVSLAASLNPKISKDQQLKLLLRVDSDCQKIMDEAIESGYSNEIIAGLRVQLWWIALMKISRTFNARMFKEMRIQDVTNSEITQMYESEAELLKYNPASSKTAMCLGCTNDSDPCDVSWATKKPKSIGSLPQVLQLIWADSPTAAIEAVSNTPPVKVVRAASIQKKIATTRDLQKEIKDEMLTQYSSDSLLLKQIELSAEGFEIIHVMQSIEDVDRTASMLSGPFFTSKNYPALNLYPIVQIDLRVASEIIGESLGDGLLQLWHTLGDTDGEIRIVPRSEVDASEMTNFVVKSIDDENRFPLPPEWPSDPSNHGVLTFESYKSLGMVGYSSALEGYLNDLQSEKTVSKHLLELVKRFKKDSVDPSKHLMQLFGTFYPIQYSAVDIGRRCLFSIRSWGSSGCAQIFYEIKKDGMVSFEFMECMR